MKTLLLALSAALVLSACGESATDFTGRPSPEGGTWGPLAVTPSDGGGMEALI